MKRRWGGERTSAFLVLVILLTFGLSTSLARAFVPRIEVLDISENGNNTILTLVISHFNWQDHSSYDYCTKVAIKLNGGAPKVYSLNTDQSRSRFIIDIDLGVVPDGTDLEVSLYCTINGWTPWYEGIEIPEFPLIPGALLFAVLTLGVVLFRAQKRP